MSDRNVPKCTQLLIIWLSRRFSHKVYDKPVRPYINSSIDQFGHSRFGHTFYIMRYIHCTKYLLASLFCSILSSFHGWRKRFWHRYLNLKYLSAHLDHPFRIPSAMCLRFLVAKLTTVCQKVTRQFGTKSQTVRYQDKSVPHFLSNKRD